MNRLADPARGAGLDSARDPDGAKRTGWWGVIAFVVLLAVAVVWLTDRQNPTPLPTCAWGSMRACVVVTLTRSRSPWNSQAGQPVHEPPCRGTLSHEWDCVTQNVTRDVG